MAVPTLDYSHFTAGSHEQQLQFANDLLESFERTGFCKLKGHSFDAKRLERLFGLTKQFFDQPLEAKNEIANKKGPSPMRGFTPRGIEEISRLSFEEKIRKMKDVKEHFDQGPDDDQEYPNKWPSAPELSDFQPFMENFYSELNSTCVVLMKALEVAWGITDGSLVARCFPHATDFRLTHYPPTSVDELSAGKTMRIAPHTDFGLITLLFQDSVGGLEVEDSATKKFVPIPPGEPTEMVVNVGDTLTRWTNGRIFGGVHQVTSPEAMKGQNGLMLPSRMSAAYFFKAGRHTSVAPLPKFITEERPSQFPDITALEFQEWRNSIIYNMDKQLSLDGTKRGPATVATAMVA